MTVNIHFHIGRRHLRYLPPTMATIVAIFCIAWWATAAALFLIVGAYVATAIFIALVDLIVSRYRERRRQAAIARSVALHPSHVHIQIDGPMPAGTIQRVFEDHLAGTLTEIAQNLGAAR